MKTSYLKTKTTAGLSIAILALFAGLPNADAAGRNQAGSKSNALHRAIQSEDAKAPVTVERQSAPARATVRPGPRSRQTLPARTTSAPAPQVSQREYGSRAGDAAHLAPRIGPPAKRAVAIGRVPAGTADISSWTAGARQEASPTVSSRPAPRPKRIQY
jgi:hypothetical protein